MAAASGDMRRVLEACTAALELKVQDAVAEHADLAANALVAGLSISCLATGRVTHGGKWLHGGWGI